MAMKFDLHSEPADFEIGVDFEDGRADIKSIRYHNDAVRLMFYSKTTSNDSEVRSPSVAIFDFKKGSNLDSPYAFTRVYHKSAWHNNGIKVAAFFN